MKTTNKKPKMTITEVTVSKSAVIPVAAYENLRPSFSITAQPDKGESAAKVILYINTWLNDLMREESNRCKTEYLEKIYAWIRWYLKDGIRFPSVTSILGLDKTFGQFTEQELQQYASRGNILEVMIEVFLMTGLWPEPQELPQCREDIEILAAGNLNLSWKDGSHEAFMAEYGSKIKVEAFQKTVFNQEQMYAGTLDILGEFDGKRSIMDIKSGTFDMRQLAAYAVCEEGIEQLVILPIGPTENKCGFKKPVICTTIDNEFREFIKARAKFRQRFGV